MIIPTLTYLTSISLKHQEDCSLLGAVTDDTSGTILYVEEIYSADAWVAQHKITLKGEFLESIDEDFGVNDHITPLSIPSQAVKPQRGWHTMTLNYAGPRHRGMRETERVVDVIKPLSIAMKMALAQRFKLEAPLIIIGMAESYVLAEIPLTRPNLFIVCRRMRLAIALPETKLDERGQTYDYDTLVIYRAHFHRRDTSSETLVEDLLEELPGITLNRPMDCLLYADHIFIADGGSGDLPSRIHVWHLQLPESEETGDE
ncbi:MAG: hypothetical protein H7Y09_06375 [Chitinophagaceae bacterium]|nr:hypothetical protein [Anaerolineae bacterium]